MKAYDLALLAAPFVAAGMDPDDAIDRARSLLERCKRDIERSEPRPGATMTFNQALRLLGQKKGERLEDAEPIQPKSFLPYFKVSEVDVFDDFASWLMVHGSNPDAPLFTANQVETMLKEKARRIAERGRKISKAKGVRVKDSPQTPKIL